MPLYFCTTVSPSLNFLNIWAGYEPPDGTVHEHTLCYMISQHRETPFHFLMIGERVCFIVRGASQRPVTNNKHHPATVCIPVSLRSGMCWPDVRSTHSACEAEIVRRQQRREKRRVDKVNEIKVSTTTV